MRLRAILGLIGGVILILSSAMHSLLGWKAISAQLTALHAPDDLRLGFGLGWQFGGVAILTFGIMAVTLFAQRLRGRTVSAFPLVCIATAYTLFGIAALVVSRFDPFFLIFIVPGILIGIGATAASEARSR